MRARRALAPLLGLELVFVLLWNSGFIGAEYGLPYAGPWTLLLWRYAALAALLAVWMTVTKRWSWPGRPAVGHTAVVGVLAHGVWLGCVLVSIDMDVPVGIIALVTSLQPLLTGALAGLVVNERTDARQWLGLVVGFLGVSIAVVARLSLESDASWIGYLLPFVSVIGMTSASLLQRRWNRSGVRDSLPMDATLLIQSLATALALLLPAWLAEDFETAWTRPFIATMIWLIFAVSIGAYAAMWRLLANQEATRVASLFYLSPPVTMVMAWVAFGDEVIATDLLGLAVAAVGVWLVYRKRASFQQPTPEPPST